MKTCIEMRRDNLAKLIKQSCGIESLAERYGCTPAAIKTWLKGYKDSKSGTPRGIGDAVARKVEELTGKEIGWMDHDHDNPTSLDDTQKLLIQAFPLLHEESRDSWIFTAKTALEKEDEEKRIAA